MTGDSISGKGKMIFISPKSGGAVQFNVSYTTEFFFPCFPACPVVQPSLIQFLSKTPFSTHGLEVLTDF
jgi:hypothetical protein